MKFLHRKSHVFLQVKGCFGWLRRQKAGGESNHKFQNARMVQVRHRSYATFSRQPRQVRKEATVTGSFVCSESPVPDLIVLEYLVNVIAVLNPPPKNLYTSFTTFFAINHFSSIKKK